MSWELAQVSGTLPDGNAGYVAAAYLVAVPLALLVAGVGLILVANVSARRAP